MKAVFGSLVLACLILLIQSSSVFAASLPCNSNNYWGAVYASSLHSSGQEDVGYALSLAEMGYSCILYGDYKAAEGRLRQALQFDPELVNARCNLGFVLNKTGRAAEALTHLQYAYKLAPNQPVVLQTMAASYQLLGNYPVAVALYKQYVNSYATATDAWYISALAKHLEAEQVNFAKEDDGNDCSKSGERYCWNHKNLRVYVKPAQGLNGYRPEFDEILHNSFAKWSESGVLRFSFVDTPEQSDIECAWTDDPRKLSSAAEGGEAFIDHKGNIVAHARIYLLSSRPGSPIALTDQDVRALCLHEVGHALGLVKHSSHPEDVMFSTVAAAEHPSMRDLNDLKQRYILQSSIKSDSPHPLHLI